MKAMVINGSAEVLYDTGHFRAEIEIAQRKSGDWAWSIDVWAHNRGYGTPKPHCSNAPVFPTKQEARKDGVREILDYLERSRGDMRNDITGLPCSKTKLQLEKMISAIKAELQPKYVQLTLF